MTGVATTECVGQITRIWEGSITWRQSVHPGFHRCFTFFHMSQLALPSAQVKGCVMYERGCFGK